MNKQSRKLLIPPIGFIVEGKGEYNSYPSLIYRILNISGSHIPIVNAGGCGNITKNLKGQLDLLVHSYHPYNIIITCDLYDCVDNGTATNCVDLVNLVHVQVQDWINNASTSHRCKPMPHYISFVVQVEKFETWLISNVCNLSHIGIQEKQIKDVDNNIRKPAKWLQKRLPANWSTKNPKQAKEIVSKLQPNEMRKNSRSFDKFYRETISCYKNWCRYSGVKYSGQ